MHQLAGIYKSTYFKSASKHSLCSRLAYHPIIQLACSSRCHLFSYYNPRCSAANASTAMAVAAAAHPLCSRLAHHPIIQRPHHLLWRRNILDAPVHGGVRAAEVLTAKLRLTRHHAGLLAHMAGWRVVRVVLIAQAVRPCACHLPACCAAVDCRRLECLLRWMRSRGHAAGAKLQFSQGAVAKVNHHNQLLKSQKTFMYAIHGLQHFKRFDICTFTSNKQLCKARGSQDKEQRGCSRVSCPVHVPLVYQPRPSRTGNAHLTAGAPTQTCIAVGLPGGVCLQ